MNRGITPAVLVCILGFAGLCLAMVTITNKGTWPDTWPKELEQYRAQAKTHGVAHGISENVHEISFAKRDEFEKAWPHILKLRSSGTRLVLQTSPSMYSVSGSEMGPGVRILVAETIITGAANPEAQPKEEEDPLTGTELQELVKQGKMLKTGPPWPKYIMIDDELPEYVQAKYVDGKQKWEPVDAGIRARLDIELVVDGSIVDLNRIQLPPNTLIIDNRFNKE
jgi:hypothetical protein